MSIHGSHSADSVATGMHLAIGGIGQAAIAAWMLSRQQADILRAENAAACATAASRARAAVMARSAADLHERLADAHADVGFLRDDNATLRRRVAELEQRCQILADACLEAGLAD